MWTACRWPLEITGGADIVSQMSAIEKAEGVKPRGGAPMPY